MTTYVRENLDDPKYRLAIDNDLAGLTLPVLADSYSRMSDIVKDVASDVGAVFVDGYSGVPRDLLYFSDHVHLTREGSLRLGRVVAEGLLNDPRFLDLADRVRRGKKQRGVELEAEEHTVTPGRRQQ